MSEPRRKSPEHPYEPEPYPILEAWPEFWWMSDEEKSAYLEARARQYGGSGYRPRGEPERDDGRGR
jgi:hypothetical protein